ncbi:glyoxylase-like metal-dependent hydrolase (beta-lactamase superfamily II) [Hymenobacter luteus]|uniref:Glyoxylase-like metal-dependent hydrolase (Beta-lactamase superfamily II) n=2 Tax=Hymenobacter TaxID=89966 RepID=A0A7W9WCB5_9BACT|nr:MULTISPECIES: MBL fold metallo-hydrolase [Hymenobacter]MBB4602808.1 glyoxylase-like metal-dependent hydrolase (beta-lactamase superfamily II) [Hymenobacter latericoloratus]MBB6060699.1 glyoxylase-like metal-dependent hydrolase (beta-lactamase superfamily II) [Hymenobacter luteus]
MTVSGFTFNAFSENTYLLHDATGQCVVIDPGCYERAEQEALRRFIEQQGLRVVLLLNTHCHIDHVLGNQFILGTYQVPFLIHEADLATLRAVPAYAPSYGFARYVPAEPTGFLTPGEPVRFGNTELAVHFAPGHAPGHVVFYHASSSTVIGGDVLFQGSIGRTDLPGGDHATLISSIKTELFTLPDDTVVYPGHGPATTVGQERRTNPFLQ